MYINLLINTGGWHCLFCTDKFLLHAEQNKVELSAYREGCCLIVMRTWSAVNEQLQETMDKKGRVYTLCWNKIESHAVPSQWNGCHSGSLCVHNCSLKVQQWSLTPNGIHSLDLSTLKSSQLYIKHHVSEIHLDSYTFFNFFFLGLYHTLRSFINELAGSLHHETCLHMARAR